MQCDFRSKMIPDFEKHGDLPTGIHKATLEEISNKFEKGSLKRNELTKKLLRFISFICNHATDVYLFGSYITKKLSPSDVDIFVILKENFDFTGKSGSILVRYQFNPDKLLHIYFCTEKDRKRKKVWLQWCSKIRGNPNRSKGFIRLE